MHSVMTMGLPLAERKGGSGRRGEEAKGYPRKGNGRRVETGGGLMATNIQGARKWTRKGERRILATVIDL